MSIFNTSPPFLAHTLTRSKSRAECLVCSIPLYIHLDLLTIRYRHFINGRSLYSSLSKIAPRPRLHTFHILFPFSYGFGIGLDASLITNTNTIPSSAYPQPSAVLKTERLGGTFQKLEEYRVKCCEQVIVLRFNFIIHLQQ